MVAISLYRGNLHRVPDVPRGWLMPNHKISLKDFKSLLARHSKALSRLNATTTPNPNFNPSSDPIATVQSSSLGVQSEEPAKVANNNPGQGTSSKVEERDRRESQLAAGCSGGSMKKPVGDGSDSFVDTKIDVIFSEKAPDHEDGGDASMEKQNEPILNADEELKRRSSMQGVATRGPSVPLQVDGMNDTGSMLGIWSEVGL